MEAWDIHVALPSGGDVTITLKDVAVLLGLSIDDPRITGTDDRDWAVECEWLLCVASPPTALKGALKLTWGFREQFLMNPLTAVLPSSMHVLISSTWSALLCSRITPPTGHISYGYLLWRTSMLVVPCLRVVLCSHFYIENCTKFLRCEVHSFADMVHFCR